MLDVIGNAGQVVGNSALRFDARTWKGCWVMLVMLDVIGDPGFNMFQQWGKQPDLNPSRFLILKH